MPTSHVPARGAARGLRTRLRLPRRRGASCTMWRTRRSRHLDRYSLPLCCRSLPGEVFLLSLSMYITSLQTEEGNRSPRRRGQVVASVGRCRRGTVSRARADPIMLTFRLVAACQVQPILVSENLSFMQKERQLASPPVCYRTSALGP